MTNRELADLLMARIYDQAERDGYHAVHNLTEIAREFGVTDAVKVDNIARSLDSRGYINAGISHESASAILTGDGALFVEAGGDTGIIAEFRRSPTQFIVDNSTHFHGAISGSNVAVHSTVGSQGVDANVETLFRAITDRLASDHSLDEAQRRELQADIDSLRSELRRSSPRRGMLRELLSTLSDVSSIAQLALQVQAALKLVT